MYIYHANENAEMQLEVTEVAGSDGGLENKAEKGVGIRVTHIISTIVSDVFCSFLWHTKV